MSRPADSAFHVLSRVLATVVVTVLSACGASPPQPTVIAATIDATADLNPDGRGRASPVVVRLFELKTVSAFGVADFFSLWDRESEALGGDLVARDELQLRPGERKTFARTLQPDTHHIAVIAAFRDLERARWRGAVAVVPHRTQAVTIKLESRAVTIATE